MKGKDSYSSCPTASALFREKAAAAGHRAVWTGARCGDSHLWALVLGTAGSH